MTERSNPQLNDTDLELLSAYIDDQLAPDERSMLEERLRHEPALRAALDELRATVGLLRELEPVQPPRSFTLDPATVARRPPLFRWLSLGPALVAVVLAFGFLAFFVSRSGSGTPAAAPAPMAGAPAAPQEAIGATAAPAAAAAAPTNAPAAAVAPGALSSDRTATEATAAPAAPDTAITLAAPAEQPTAAAAQPPAEAPAEQPGAARPPEQAPTSAPIATSGNASSETFSLATPQPAGQAPPAAPPPTTAPFRVIGIGLGALLVVLLGLWALRAAQRGR